MLIKSGNIVLLFILLFPSNSILGKSIEVGTAKPFQSFIEAYEYANDGDSIIIYDGYYELNNFEINKSIVIQGRNFPIFSGAAKNHIILVKADSVVITGLKLVKSGTSFINDNAAIKLEEVENCLIKGNILENNFFGIYLSKSSRCIISDNIIESDKKRETFSGNGIHVWYSRDIIISNNKIRGHRDGIYFEFVRAGKIFDNISEKNLRYGLHFMFSDSCIYTENTFRFNGAGVAVMYTKFVTMQNNLFIQNWGTASYGLLLKEIYDAEIKENLFLQNTSAIYLEGCSRVSVTNNVFKSNGWGIKLMGNSMDNRFTLNDFINNTFDLTTNNMSNFNLIEENFWSKQNGYDLDGDGYCDEEYHPVRFFSVIAEKNSSLFIFIRSFVVELLDMMESVIPTLTPQNVVDRKPRIVSINNEANFDTGK